MESGISKEKKQLTVALALVGLLAALVVVLSLSGYLGSIYEQLRYAFKGKDQFREYVESWGAGAPLAFMGLQIFQVVMAPIPGEFTGLVGGFTFGALPNVIYSTIGLTVGSILAFLAARIIGLPLVRLVVNEETLDKFQFLTEKTGALVVLVFFTIPGFPKDILSYLLGLSPMGLLTFVVVCALGRIPGTVMLSYTGSALFEENWPLLTGVCLLCLVALVLGFLYRERIESWLKRANEQD